jgi:LysM domain
MTFPYTVISGDTLSGIAKKHGIKDWQVIYNHPDNSGLRRKRPNPDRIFPGDIVMIPTGLTPPSASSAPPAERTCDLAPTSPFASWPAGLLETICRSYKAHTSSNRYLDNAFWGGIPSSFEDAITRLGVPVQNNALKWVYTRAAAIAGLWPFIRFIHNLWSGDSHGFAFTCTDKVRLRAFLDSSPSLCRDIPLMMSDHQAAGPAQCWREVVNGTAGLHICVPKDDAADQGTVAGESSIHIDPHQTVKGKDPDGTCSYSAAGTLDHARDVGAGVLRRLAEEQLRKIEKLLP